MIADDAPPNLNEVSMSEMNKILGVARSEGIDSVPPAAKSMMIQFVENFNKVFVDSKPSTSKTYEKLAVSDTDTRTSSGDGNTTTTDESAAESESSSNTDVSESKSKRKRMKKQNKHKSTRKDKKVKTKKQQSASNDNQSDNDIKELRRAMDRLDSRRVPAPEKFDESSGSDLKNYLKKFEIYCKHNFRGEEEFWVDELERQLTGELLAVFKIMKAHDDSYREVKEKLLDHYKELRESRKNKRRAVFRSMTYNKGETVYLYSARLEKQFKIAYPNHDVKNSKTLQTKFVESLPKKVRAPLKSHMLTYRMANVKSTWKVFQKWARCYDSEQLSNSTDADPVEEIVINIGDGNTYKNSVRPRLNDRYENNSSGQTPASGAPIETKISNNWSTNGNNSRLQCQYCSKYGHAANSCRVKLKLCLLCGANDHFVRSCPYSSDDRRRQPYVPTIHRPYSASPQPRNSPQTTTLNDKPLI